MDRSAPAMPLPLFDSPVGGNGISHAEDVPYGDALPALDLPALDGLDWAALYGQLDDSGVALTPPLLSREQCQELIGAFGRRAPFRSTVVMQRHGFGRGTYKYFAAPLPPLVRALRERLYPPLARLANRWAAPLGERAFPATLAELTAECAAAGQHRPTPLLLHYGPGDHACLHQDVYGDIVFPLQIAIMLNEPGTDFTGGENVFVEQRPRAQSKAVVVTPGLGQGMIFPVRHRPVRGSRGYQRHAMRHGTNAVATGTRTTLGVIFHDAR
ncbi:2OG-Fe(II) oxygenase [Streptomyces noursei]|uniref:2OG-Fe(II) oxygenase n=1 Tax=Streptomyces noursei TaxID=1971 RepID=UPI0016735250|nr:2OG-Fe(II) oxygenase [Streptomyces noursei]MCZ1018738.1 2OG-Fe(II) oxygenase [Streptomyces noursei]